MKYRNYRKKTLQPARPYDPAIDGETTAEMMCLGVTINPIDAPPREGGMIARNPDNPNDCWYISPEAFARTYELAEQQDDN